MSVETVDEGSSLDSGYETIPSIELSFGSMDEIGSVASQIADVGSADVSDHETDSLFKSHQHMDEERENNEVEQAEEATIVTSETKDETGDSVPPSENGHLSSDFKKFLKRKSKRIWQAVSENEVEVLRLACVSPGGLVSDEIRRVVWPKLVGSHLVETSPRPTQAEVEGHPYYRQVVMDVDRSLQRFPPSIAEGQRLRMLDQLVALIMRVLVRNPTLHYYQGYHDICVTFLLVLGEEQAFYALDILSRSHLSTFMEESMAPTIHLLEHMYSLIRHRSLLLHSFLTRSEVGVAFGLSWLITWFGHVLGRYDDVVRLFDLFLVSPPWTPLYLTTAIVLHRQNGVMERDCEMASVHSFLARIPEDLPFEDLVSEAFTLMKDYPPEKLAKERPFVKKDWPDGRRSLLQRIARTVKLNVRGSNVALPLFVAAAVLVSAVVYQTYKY